MVNKLFFSVLILLLSVQSKSQETFPVNGLRDKTTVYHAFMNATIHLDYENEINDALLLIYQDRIIYAGSKEKKELPKNTIIHDCAGLHIYPSFIELHSDYGITGYKKNGKAGMVPQYERERDGPFHWNDAITPQFNAAGNFSPQKSEAEELRKLGFGTVLSHNPDGIARGTSVLVSLAEGRENKVVLNSKAAVHFSFQKGSSSQAYPTSLMGAIALLRQTYYDAQWYKNNGETKQRNLSLEAFNENISFPSFFEVRENYDILRASKCGEEFNVKYIYSGNGDEYQIAGELVDKTAGIILPLNFPDAYDVSDPELARFISLEKMKHWEMAPSNLFLLSEYKIPIAISSKNLEKKEKFWPNINKALQRGLSKEEALKALTFTPAAMLNMQHELGSLDEGKIASFIISSADLFGEGAKILENWVQGEKYIINDRTAFDLNGNYDLNINDVYYDMLVKGEKGKYKGKLSRTIGADTIRSEVAIASDHHQINLVVEENSGIFTLSGSITKENRIWEGTGLDPSGEIVKWNAIRKVSKMDTSNLVSHDTAFAATGKLLYPFASYGFDSLPRYETILFKNASIWTNELNGKIENASLLISEGKIIAVGKSVDPNLLLDKDKVADILVIDCKGKHITSGIIDEHSHIAIRRGVNEGSHASSAEVRIKDVINPADINIYRQLAGGVVVSQLLHGSANPIGGQSAIIKLRWGETAENLIMEEAPEFIKFALGENVKQSNWGEKYTIRFPQTRMGVEQVFYDKFYSAKEYAESKKTNPREIARKENKKSGQKKAFEDEKKGLRTDLELEALAEILAGERHITCHSYVQSEINMLMHVADSMDFEINTFTHILEGYKVADKMAERNIAGSTFSDWWAYKMEVRDAIPYNAALMHNQGVLTGINSDDPEMARRLNQEAAKIVKYGGVSEEVALKMITLNPAIMMHIDEYTGSIKAGKHADIVIWSEHPLSAYAKAELTFVDGKRYFDRSRDLELRKRDRKERARLTQRMLNAKEKGETISEPVQEIEEHYDCESIENEFQL